MQWDRESRPLEAQKVSKHVPTIEVTGPISREILLHGNAAPKRLPSKLMKEAVISHFKEVLMRDSLSLIGL